MLIHLFIFLFGLAIGSFLNCVIYRLEKGGSFLKGRSYCPYCKHILSWQDLIPVFSFLFLKGKCRYCKKEISIQYPLVEISTGLIFLLISNFQFPISNEFSIFNFQTLFWILISCFLIIIFVYDFKHYIIPDKVIYPAIAIIFFYNLILNPQLLIPNLISAFGAGAFFLAIVFFSRGRWMGAGDIKLGFLMGLLLGFPDILVALFFAFLIGAIIGVGLIMLKKKTLRSEVPFGPFLIIGIYTALFFGEKIINWYLNLFFI